MSYPYLKTKIPLVLIHNAAEAVVGYVARTEEVNERRHLIREMQALGDRALLYPAPAKLVFVSLPLHHEKMLWKLGYTETHYCYPQDPSPFLSLDLLREETLLKKIVDYAGESKSVQLIPYATTPQFLHLVSVLKTNYNLKVLLPESPEPHCLWLRDYIDSKSGFRHLVSEWLADTNALPQGFICADLEVATSAAFWFTQHHKACIIKSDFGNDALGHTVILSKQEQSINPISLEIQKNCFLSTPPDPKQFFENSAIEYYDQFSSLYLRKNLLIVEEYIPSPELLFPSAEFFVPSPESGTPYLTYVCNQLFLPSGTFSGILVSPDFRKTEWYSSLANRGLYIANQLQKLGYVGHFDLDGIVDQNGSLYLLEINARRTGGTYIHELACFLLGQDYLKNTTLISNAIMSSGRITEIDRLVEILSSILYPIYQSHQGVVITHSSNLVECKFGCVIIASCLEQGLQLRQKMIDLLSSN